MGKVFSWKLMAITSSDKSEWAGPLYSWLAAPGEPTNSGQISGEIDDSYLLKSKNYTKKLTTIEAYTAAFERMKGSLPFEFLCTSGLKTAEDYFKIDCETGGEKRWCGLEEIIEEEVLEFTVIPITSYGNTFSYKFVGKNIGGVDFLFDSSSPITPSYENCETVDRDTICTYSGTVTASGFTVHTLQYETDGGDTATRNFEREEISLVFNETQVEVPYDTTEYTFTYTSDPQVNIAVNKGECDTCEIEYPQIKVSFGENTGYEDKEYTVTGTMSFGGQTKMASITITQKCQDRYLRWVETSPVTVPYSQQSKTLHYETNIDPGYITVESSNSVFRVGTPAANSVVISFSQNTTEEERSATISLRSEYTSTQNLSLVQEGYTMVPEIALTPAATSVDYVSGGIVTITASTKWCGIIPANVELSPENCNIGFSILSNTTDSGSESGAMTVKVTFEGYGTQPDTGGSINLMVRKDGFADNNVSVDCDGGTHNVSLTRSDTSFSLTVHGQDSEGQWIHKTCEISVV